MTAHTRIINIFSMSQNPYNENGWQVWIDSRLVAVCHTRAEARAVIRDHNFGLRRKCFYSE